ncbi:MAG: dihydroorotate dehydrogenase, partial [bacterium]
MSIKEDFLTCIKAGAKIVQIISYETQRVQGLVAEVAQELNRSWYTWNRIEGTKKWGSNGF